MGLNKQDLKVLMDRVHTNEMQTILQYRYSKPDARSKDIYWSNQAYREANDLIEAIPSEPYSGNEDSNLKNHIWSVAGSSLLFSVLAIKNLQLRANYIHYSKNLALQEINQLTGKTDPAGRAAIKKNTQRMSVIFEQYEEENEDSLSLAHDYVEDDSPPVEPLSPPMDTIEPPKNPGQLLKNIKFGGEALFVLTLGVMIWTIQESRNPQLSTIKNTLNLVATGAGAVLGTQAGIAAAGILAPEAVIIGGILGGIICSFVSGMAANSLFDAVIQAFMAPPSPKLTANLFGQPILYEIQLPDNLSLSTSLSKSLSFKL